MLINDELTMKIRIQIAEIRKSRPDEGVVAYSTRTHRELGVLRYLYPPMGLVDRNPFDTEEYDAHEARAWSIDL